MIKSEPPGSLFKSWKIYIGGVFMNELKRKIKDLLEEIEDQKKLEELYQYAKMLLRSK